MHNEHDNKNIGQNIKYYRLKRGLTPKELSNKIYRMHALNISDSEIKMYEKGHKVIPAYAIQSIAAITQIDLQEFFEPSDPCIMLNKDKIELLEAFSTIKTIENKKSVLDLAKKLVKN